MPIEIVVNAGSNETRIAILEDKRLVELWVERASHERMVGDIYKGRVEAILPGLQAAFIDIGMEKSAFLHLSDITEGLFDAEDIQEGKGGEVPHRRRRAHASAIEDMLKGGQEVLVQISKEPMGTKGCRVTTQLSLAGRFVVLVPSEENVGVSKKLDDQEERQRLRKIAGEARPEGFGLIVRTAAEGKDKKDLKTDAALLVALHDRIKRRAERMRAPALIQKEVSLTTSLVRDLFTENVDGLLIDSRREYREILYYLRSVAPELRHRIKLYEGKAPIFEAHEVEDQIEKALQRKVWIKRGGYITIDQTEALVAIDVNTGRFVGKRDPEQTILETNLEAAKEIARQLRLRDVGGIIVIDFIDMESKGNRKKVLEALKEGLKNDKARTKAYEVGPLGLVEMTRKRVRPSLWHTFCEPCPSCEGTGRVLSRLTMAIRLERWLKKFGEELRGSRLEVRVHPTVAGYLQEEGYPILAQLERDYDLRLNVSEESSLPLEEFQVHSLDTNMEITEEFFR
jgi:ribonuclease G